MVEKTRRCSRCGRVKPIEEFASDNRSCNKCKGYTDKRRAAFPEKVREISRQSAAASRARAKGIAPEEAERITSGPCDGCLSMPTKRRHSLYVSRSTGLVDGALCQRCTTALGFLDHDPERLERLHGLLTSVEPRVGLDFDHDAP